MMQLCHMVLERGSIHMAVWCCNASIQDSRFGTTSSYFGSACECDNSRCDTTNGLLCGGTNQGLCQCGGCQCLGSYYGSACQCSNTLCVDPNDRQVEMGCEEEGEEGTRDHQIHVVAFLSLKILEGKDFRTV